MENLGMFVICVVLIAIILEAIFLSKKGSKNCEYDERQELARGKAFRAAYFTILGYLVVSELVTSILDRPWCDSFTNLGYGVSISAVVFAMVCIMKDAYVGFNQKAARNIAMLAVIGAFNIMLGIFALIDKQDYISDDKLTTIPVNLPIGIVLIIISITLFIKTQLAKKEAD